MHVLLVEDEGNRVSTCFDGRTGLRAAQTSPFDVVVLDVMLTFLDGLRSRAVCARRRSVRRS